MHHSFFLRLSTCAIFLFFGISRAENLRTGSLGGKVIDVYSHSSVGNVEVFILGKDIEPEITDSSGVFLFDSLPVGAITMQVRGERIQTQTVPTIEILQGYNRELTIEVQNHEHIQELNKVTVASSRVITKKTDQVNSVTRLTRDELSVAPGAIEDLNRMIQTLPSVVAASSSGWNTFLVRGGNDEENLFVVDGIETPNLSHWGTSYSSSGAINILHPDLIDNVDFYSGGFPVTLPPRLSSITDIRLRDGSMNRHRWQADMSMGGAGLFGEGPLLKECVSYIVSGRISFLDILQPLLNIDGLPKYQNGQAKITWNANKNNRISLIGIAGHETIKLDSEDNTEDIHDEGLHVNGGLNWNSTASWGSNTILISGRYDRFTESATRFDSLTYWRWNNRHSSLQFKDDLKIFCRDADLLTAGVSVEGQKKADNIGSDEYFVFADTITGKYLYSFNIPSGDNLLEMYHEENTGFDTSSLGYRISGYAGYTLSISPVKFSLGVRNDYFTINKENGLSPRGSFSLDMGNAGEASLSGGMYYQSPLYASQISKFQDLGLLPLQRNYQGTFGYMKQLTDVVAAGAEAYYKYYDREPLYSFNDGIRTIEASKKQNGRKRAYGVEVYLQKKKFDKLFYQGSYTLFNVERRYTDGKWYDDDYNLRNAMKLVLGANINRNHKITTRLDFSEGAPYTPVDNAASTSNFETIRNTSKGWNYERRDPRVFFSFRYEFTFYIRHATFSTYMEVENLFNSKDLLFEYYALGDSYGEGKIQRFYGRGILPVGGMKITF